MKLILAVFICFVQFNYGAEIGNPLTRFSSGSLRTNTYCGKEGLNSGVTCLSRTHFIMNGEDRDKVKSFQCTGGTVCANVPNFCVADIEPDCTNEEPDSLSGPTQCGVCGANDKMVCVSQTAYALCSNGKPNMDFVRQCSSEKRFCNIKVITLPDEEDETITTTTTTTCEEFLQDATCESASAAFQCTEAGIFAVLSDKSCKAYYSCTLVNGVLEKADYKCPSRYVFNRFTKRCERSRRNTCP